MELALLAAFAFLSSTIGRQTEGNGTVKAQWQRIFASSFWLIGVTFWSIPTSRGMNVLNTDISVNGNGQAGQAYVSHMIKCSKVMPLPLAYV